MEGKLIDLGLAALSSDGVVAIALLYVVFKFGSFSQWYENSKKKMDGIDVLSKNVTDLKAHVSSLEIKIEHIAQVVDKLDSKVRG